MPKYRTQPIDHGKEHNPQSAVAPNLTFLLDAYARHLASFIRQCIDAGIAEIQPTEEAEQEWLDEVMSYADKKFAFNDICTPGYANSEGDRSPLVVRKGHYGGGAQKFLQMLYEWRQDGLMPSLEYSCLTAVS